MSGREPVMKMKTLLALALLGFSSSSFAMVYDCPVTRLTSAFGPSPDDQRLGTIRIDTNIPNNPSENASVEIDGSAFAAACNLDTLIGGTNSGKPVLYCPFAEA